MPDALIIVTGGVPQNNQTEGKLMADWLIKKGIKPERIYQDNYARSTVENALYSRYALAKHRIKMPSSLVQEAMFAVPMRYSLLQVGKVAPRY